MLTNLECFPRQGRKKIWGQPNTTELLDSHESKYIVAVTCYSSKCGNTKTIRHGSKIARNGMKL